MNIRLPSRTAQHVLSTNTEVEIEVAVRHKGDTYETNHAGKQQAWICRDRLHGPSDCAEVAGMWIQADSVRPKPCKGGGSNSVRRQRRTEDGGPFLQLCCCFVS